MTAPPSGSPLERAGITSSVVLCVKCRRELLSCVCGRRPTVLCANCLHPEDKHKEKTDCGKGCAIAIAVSWSDGAVGCECERFIPQGKACSVKDCEADAVHFRMNKDEKLAFDMCVKHYEEAEPYCKRYYELTGGITGRRGVPCELDGCKQPAKYVHYSDMEGYGLDLCEEHKCTHNCNEDNPEGRDCNEPLRPRGEE